MINENSIRIMIEDLKSKADFKRNLAEEISSNELEASRQLCESRILQECAIGIEVLIDRKVDLNESIRVLIYGWRLGAECRDETSGQPSEEGIRPHEGNRLNMLCSIWESKMLKACAAYLEKIVNEDYDNQESD